MVIFKHILFSQKCDGKDINIGQIDNICKSNNEIDTIQRNKHFPRIDKMLIMIYNQSK